jgi:hypothetical protein
MTAEAGSGVVASNNCSRRSDASGSIRHIPDELGIIALLADTGHEDERQRTDERRRRRRSGNCVSCASVWVSVRARVKAVVEEYVWRRKVDRKGQPHTV